MPGVIEIDGSKVADWESFHDVFANGLGFPKFYGRNSDAWIDCMTYLDDPEAGMSKIHAPKNGVLALQILNARAFEKKCPEIWKALQEMAAFVNWRRIETGDSPVLALSYNG